ncbi:MAG: SdrD B-like domain-containing protein [Bacteroidota bacterium]
MYFSFALILLCNLTNAQTFAVIGDYVWNDANKNGLQDADEVGLPGVVVNLKNASNVIVASTITEDNGFYSFSNEVAISNYKLSFLTPVGFTPAVSNVGVDDTKDSDPVGGTISGITVALGATASKYDAGFYQQVDPVCSFTNTTPWGTSVEFKGVVYEGSASGITSKFTYTVKGGCVKTVSHFDFGNLICSGCFDDISDFAGVTGPNPQIGTDPTSHICGIKFDHALSCNETQTVSFTLKGYYNVGLITFAAKSGTNVEYIGICGPVCSEPESLDLGNAVWADQNNNGIKDAGEDGLAGVNVKLYDCGGNYLNRTAITDADGNYHFDDIPTGYYIVGVTPPAGYGKGNVGTTDVQTDDQNDGVNVSGGEVRTACFLLTATNDNIDFGLKGTGSIGNYVWNDINGDGLQTAGELGIADVTVTLTLPDATTTQTTTNVNGHYSFDNLLPGIYSVTFTTPLGYAPSPDNQGFNDNIDSDPTGGVVQNIILAAGQNNSTIDAGFDAITAGVGDFVWWDINANGKQEANEPGIRNVTVTLYDAGNNVVGSDVTDANGEYFISVNLIATTNYTLRFTTLPANTAFTIKNAPGSQANKNSDVNPASGKTDVFSLSPDEIKLDIDAGIITIDGGPLPVTLGNLQGLYSNNVAALNWSTLTEINASHFELEYSIDGITYNKIGSIAAKGYSTNRNDYTIKHDQPKAGANYYRLKMIDIDGRAVYSNTVMINVTITAINIAGIYPNPFADKINISLATDINGLVKVRLINAAGQVLRNQQNAVRAGVNVIAINDLKSLTSGTYLLEIKMSGKVLTQKLIK